jgi:hypothetical protein
LVELCQTWINSTATYSCLCPAYTALWFEPAPPLHEKTKTEESCRKVVPLASITGHCILYICSLNIHTHIVTFLDVLVADHLQSCNSLTCSHRAEIAAPPMCIPSRGALSAESVARDARACVCCCQFSETRGSHADTRHASVGNRMLTCAYETQE